MTIARKIGLKLSSMPRRHFVFGCMGLISLGVVGCKNPLFRPQSPDDLAERLKAEAEDVQYIGSVCRMWGLNYAKVEHVALANGLNGTGSDPANNGQRNILINEMKGFNVDNPNDILASKNTSMVLVQGYLPPGAKKGDRFDIRVGVMDRSRTSSLKGGYCMETRLRPYAQLGNRTRSGHSVGSAQGPILTFDHFDSANTHIDKISGVVLGGGRCSEYRPLGLAIGSEVASVRTARKIAAAINGRFAIYDESGKIGVATPKSNRNVELMVPPEYKHNLGRFLRVIMNISFDHPETSNSDRIAKLEHQLSQPELAKKASLRLEGIGIDATGALRRALRHPNEETRFYAAESLAYLGKDTGVKHLEEAARSSDAFRWHALTALASLKETKSGTALSNLMHVEDPATRYGAFRAMRARSPQDPLVNGKKMGKKMGQDSFYLHVVPSPSKPMVHIAKRLRPEIVIFNDNQTFGEKFLFVKSGITARTTGPNSAEIKVYLQNDGDKIIKTSNRVSEVIERLAQLGCDYGCVIDLLLEAKKDGNINSNVVVDAAPKAPAKKILLDTEGNRLPEPEAARALTGPLPEIFRSGEDESDLNVYDDQVDTPWTQSPKTIEEPAKQKTGFFDRIKSPFKRKR